MRPATGPHLPVPPLCGSVAVAEVPGWCGVWWSLLWGVVLVGFVLGVGKLFSWYIFEIRLKFIIFHEIPWPTQKAFQS